MVRVGVAPPMCSGVSGGSSAEVAVDGVNITDGRGEIIQCRDGFAIHSQGRPALGPGRAEGLHSVLAELVVMIMERQVCGHG